MRQKLILFLFLFPLLAGAQVKSADNSFAKGQMDLDVGLGFGNNFYSNAANSSPTFCMSLDYGLSDEISIGAFLGYSSATYKYHGTTNCQSTLYTFEDVYKWSFSIFGMRGAYHFQRFITNNNLDLYAGLMVDNISSRYRFTTNVPCRSSGLYDSQRHGISGSFFAGMRYRFDKHIGVFSELGYGVSYITLGMNYRF